MSRTVKFTITLTAALLLGFLLARPGGTTASAMQDPTPTKPMDMAMETPTPEPASGDAPVISSGADPQAQGTPYLMPTMWAGSGAAQGGCPMMSGMGGMTGMNGMGTTQGMPMQGYLNGTPMPGMTPMPGAMNGGMMGGMGGMGSGMGGMMGGMQGMNGMGSMGSMGSMNSMGNMSNMQSMNGMGTMNSPLYYQDELEAASFWRINPWWLTGWLIFGVLAVSILAAAATGVIWLVTRMRKPKVV